MEQIVDPSSIERFKVFLRKIGSGEQTSRNLSRAESREALSLMLKGKASAAQIGAFMIAHRIRRPHPQELAGMLDTYLNLGPKLFSNSKTQNPICLGMPFDGRNKTAPIYPLTVLVLISENQPVILQGGKRMPIKYGVTTAELFASLGMELRNLTIEQVQSGFHKNLFGFIYQPDHFPLAESLINYRDEISKRTTLATMELLWTAHEGKHTIMSGFFHQATEELAWQTLKEHNENDFIFIKGLEGSTDLSIARKSIISRLNSNKLEQFNIDPKQYGFFEKDTSWESLENWKELALDAIDHNGPLLKPVIWNAANYLCFSGMANDIQDGIKIASASIESGKVKNTLMQLKKWRLNIN